MDITHSQSKARRSGRNQGQSLRFLYSKTINSTDTNFTMVGYRYSTEGYRTLSQHVEDLSSEDFLNGVSYGRQKRPPGPDGEPDAVPHQFDLS
ncbi:usher CupC3 [Pseudomonas aeruginosa]|nr:usher CupC3 [Pseudomonas aeruginosa]